MRTVKGIFKWTGVVILAILVLLAVINAFDVYQRPHAVGRKKRSIYFNGMNKDLELRQRVEISL
jgi:hypothetical protein